MSSALSLSLTVPAELNPAGVLIRVAGTQDQPMFCLADVCAVIELGSPHKVAERLDDDEKGRNQIPTPGGPQELLFVTEAGLYSVLLRSDKPQAKPLRRWVCHEVLPCIRKHGCYPAPAAEVADPTLAALAMMERQIAFAREQHLRLTAVECRVGHVEKTAQAALDTVSNNHGYYSVLGMARRLGLEMPAAEAQMHGKRLTRLCRSLGVRVGEISDSRYGYVNIYPESVLERYFEDLATS